MEMVAVKLQKMTKTPEGAIYTKRLRVKMRGAVKHDAVVKDVHLTQSFSTLFLEPTVHILSSLRPEEGLVKTEYTCSLIYAIQRPQKYGLRFGLGSMSRTIFSWSWSWEHVDLASTDPTLFLSLS